MSTHSIPGRRDGTPDAPAAAAGTTPSAVEVLLASLAEVETAAGAPVVAGEAASWTEEAGAALGRSVRPRADRTREHRTSYAAILESDIAFEPRVRDLKRAGGRLEREARRLVAELSALSTSTGDAPEPSHEPLARLLERLRAEVLAWIVGCRAHDAEVVTWLGESLNRDQKGGN